MSTAYTEQLNQNVYKCYQQQEILAATQEELASETCWIHLSARPVLKVKQDWSPKGGSSAKVYYHCQECVDKQNICKGQHNFIYAGIVKVNTKDEWQPCDCYQCPNCEAFILESYNPDRGEPDKPHPQWEFLG